MRLEKVEVRYLFASPDELNKLSGRMETSFSQCGNFVESVVFPDNFQIEFTMKSETEKRTHLKCQKNKFILETNPLELRRVAALISERQKKSEDGSDMIVTEYVTFNAMLRVIAEQK